MADRSIQFHLCRNFLVMALLIPTWANAQFAPRYRVEMVVFSRPSGAAAEQWEATPKLAYPATSRFLIDPDDQPADPASSSATSATPATVNPMEANALPGPAQPALFTTLPREQLQLAGKAAAMQGTGRYRILFHEAWWQPIGSQAESVPIVLDRSGDGGEWPALQGSITLYLSLEVYLETNLWLNTQGDYLPGSWRMPAPPLAPSHKAPASILPASGLTAEQAEVASAQGSAMNNTNSNQNDVNENLGPNYPFRHAVLLRQTQRLRSGELTYVDHPLLGVLVHISPLDPAPVTTTPAPTAAPAPTE